MKAIMSGTPAGGQQSVPEAGELLKVEDVSYGYGSDNLVLTDINMSIREGEVAVLLGPSGCGKTTLLNMMAGFTRPTAGAVRLNGKPVRKAGPDRTVVFQSSALFDWMTVLDNVIAGLHAAAQMSAREKTDRARSMLALVGLEAFANAFPRQLSGGMRQRTGLARALAPNPTVMLLDEPLAALDALTREQLQDELRQIIAVAGRSAFLITHDIEEAVLLGDRIHIMTPRPGRIAATIKPKLRNERSRVSEAFAQEVIEVRKLAMRIFQHP